MLCSKNRRSLKNLSLTKQYFSQYYGFSTLISQVLLINCFVLVLSIFYCNASSQEQFTALVLGTTAVTAVLGLLLAGSHVLKAHKIAGVHLRMEKLFDRIREGDLEARLQLRGDDNLDSLENSFNLMMDYLNQRVR